MIIDHVVLRSPRREALLADLANRFQLDILNGFKSDEVVQSWGVRFANGPFLDVFDWPSDKSPFVPLIGLAGDIAKAQEVASQHGWACILHCRNDFPIQDRPPWSTLSFKRGQGLISSFFIIEYEECPQAWMIDNYSGALYDRMQAPTETVELSGVTMLCDDVPQARLQMEALASNPIPLLKLSPTSGNRQGVGSLQIRRPEHTAAEWQPGTFH